MIRKTSTVCKVWMLLILVSACTPQRKLVYFQGSVPKADSSQANEFVMKISKGDFITFQIFVDNPEGLPGIETSIDRQLIDNRSAYEKSLVVDNNGNLEIPLVGLLHVDGMTLEQAKDSLINRFKFYLDNPVIVLKKLSFKVTFLGEFNKPGLYYIPNEKLTFSEALGLAGDLTLFADRTLIKIYRKSGTGYQELPINLTTTDAFSPEKMYVYPDDVIYAKASRKKAFATISPAVTVIASIVSSTVLIITLILKF